MWRQRKRAAHDADNARTTTTPKAPLAVARIQRPSWSNFTHDGNSTAGLVKPRYMLPAMCGRSTYKLTWEEIVRLYRHLSKRESSPKKSKSWRIYVPSSYPDWR
jgi:hypothetical protein